MISLKMYISSHLSFGSYIEERLPACMLMVWKCAKLGMASIALRMYGTQVLATTCVVYVQFGGNAAFKTELRPLFERRRI